MMDISPDSILLRGLNTKILAEYLELVGWKVAAPSSDRWLVFQGENDANGEPLEIILPSDFQSVDMSVYLATAVNLLSALADESPRETIRRVRLYDRDVLTVHNLETGDYDSIQLNVAAYQVPRLRSLFTYAACSEREPRPYFQRSLDSAKAISRRFRFGHTVPGSFGLTVESPIRGKPTIVAQYVLAQLDGDENAEPIVYLPMERRVVERIVRGLLYVGDAVEERDISPLIREYSSGFNANMCDAVIGISQNKSLPLEYSVLWSPKIEPSDDVRDVGPIRLGQMSYGYLEDAARVLKEMEPEYVQITGLVKGLGSTDDPLRASEASRWVLLSWTNRPGRGRAPNVMVHLGREDYVKAHKAHLEWSTVSVTGKLQRLGNQLELLEPRDFKVLNPRD